MFEVGKRYRTKERRLTTIVEKKYEGTRYECVKGDDGIWRYNRPDDYGRTTGIPVAEYYTYPKNLLLPACDAVCHACGAVADRVMYMGVPMTLCTNGHCHLVDGLGAWVMEFLPFNGRFVTYKEGEYWRTLWKWLSGK